MWCGYPFLPLIPTSSFLHLCAFGLPGRSADADQLFVNLPGFFFNVSTHVTEHFKAGLFQIQVGKQIADLPLYFLLDLISFAF